MDAGETCEAALVRELREEVGVAVQGRPRLISIHSAEKLFKGDHVLVYRVDRWTRVASDAEGEILRAEFFSPEALPPDVTRSSRERIREVLAGAEASSDW